jgi:hypothetical protein
MRIRNGSREINRMSHGGQHPQLRLRTSVEVEVGNKMPHVRTSSCNVVAAGVVIRGICML